MKIRAASLVHHRLSLWDSVELALGYGVRSRSILWVLSYFFIPPTGRCTTALLKRLSCQSALTTQLIRIRAMERNSFRDDG